MTSVRLQARLWYWQRISAMVLALAVLIHLVIIVVAVRGGLTAAEILGRTRGSWAFGSFYLVFVVACAVHAPIGLANVVEETFGWRGARVAWLAGLFALLLLGAGLRAVWAVVGAP
ncbi:MAG: succinate dehydrogenase [Rubrivivax sp. SCN 70-15]|nr:MAG: succinate dehydrogenase [Rubrivivax sp. SCN 70-15]